MNYCCKEMKALKNPTSGCDIEIDDRGLLSSCDDDGDRLPPVRFCPYCGKGVQTTVADNPLRRSHDLPFPH